MHPLSIFPQLFSYPFFAYFFLRLALAINVFRIGCMRWKKPYKSVAILEWVTAFFVLVGLYTQPALIAVIICVGIEWYFDHTTLTPSEKMVLWLIKVIAFALLFLGPGSFAFDLPL